MAARAPSSYGVCSTGLADFKQISLLGEGAYSSVYKVRRLADGAIYALKKVKLPSLSDKEKQNALNEVRLLASVRHENVVAYKEAFFDDKTRCLCIVMEYSDGGDLFQQIVRCQKERTHLRESDVWNFLHGMCRGLKALHSMKILHRDLKCANVFLSASENAAKLGDFNVSKVAKRGLCMTQTGTPYYASPEVWRDMPYDAKSDMWSLGCVLYEMVALRPPFRAEDMEGLYHKVLRGQYHRIPAHYSGDLADVISMLLQVNPRHRPNVEQLLLTPVMMRHARKDADDVLEGAARGLYELLNTIKLPKNSIDLSICLPKPRYHDSDPPPGRRRDEEVHMPPGDESRMVRGGTGASGNQLSAALRAGTPSGGRGGGWGHGRDSQDSLDAYLAHPHGRGESAVPSRQVSAGAAKSHSQSKELKSQVEEQQMPHPQAVPGDSLDAYIQQEQRPPSITALRRRPRDEATPEPHAGVGPTARERREVGGSSRRPLAAQQQYRNRGADPANGHLEERLGRDPSGAHLEARQAVGRDSPALGLARYSPAPEIARASPAPSSGAQRSNAGGVYGGGVLPPVRQERRQDRRPIASYVRQGMGLAAPAPAPKPSGLRLPRI